MIKIVNFSKIVSTYTKTEIEMKTKRLPGKVRDSLFG